MKRPVMSFDDDFQLGDGPPNWRIMLEDDRQIWIDSWEVSHKVRMPVTVKFTGAIIRKDDEGRLIGNKFSDDIRYDKWPEGPLMLDEHRRLMIHDWSIRRVKDTIAEITCSGFITWVENDDPDARQSP